MALFTKSDAVFYNGKRIVKAYQGSNVVLDNWTPAVMQDAGYNVSYYDPNDLRTVFLSDGVTQATPSDVGQPVGMLKDKGIRGRHYYQTVASRQPILKINSSGVYFLDFDGVDDFLYHYYPYIPSAPINFLISLALICEVKTKDTNDSQRHYSESVSSGGGPLYMFLTDAPQSNVAIQTRSSAAEIARYKGSGNNAIGTSYVNVVRINDIGSSFSYYLNNTPSNTYASPTRTGNFGLINVSSLGYQVGTWLSASKSTSAMKFYGGVMASHATDTMTGTTGSNVDNYLKRISKAPL